MNDWMSWLNVATDQLGCSCWYTKHISLTEEPKETHRNNNNHNNNDEKKRLIERWTESMHHNPGREEHEQVWNELSGNKSFARGREKYAKGRRKRHKPVVETIYRSAGYIQRSHSHISRDRLQIEYECQLFVQLKIKQVKYEDIVSSNRITRE